MKLKQFITTCVLQILLLSMPTSFAYAQATNSANPNTILYQRSTGTSSPSAKLQAREANLQTRAETEITRRISALNQLLTNVGKLKHVSSSDKASFTTQIQNEIASLTALQTKIQDDTDTTTLKTDVQSIVTSYRVFVVFMPQIRLVTAADMLLDVSSSMSSLSAKLQTRITTAQNTGQNVTTLQASLADMQNKIKDAQTQANAIIAEVTPLTPSGYPGNKSTLTDARGKFQAGIQDLRTAAQDARSIIQGLVAMGETSSSASNSAGVTQGNSSGNTPALGVPAIQNK